MIQFMGSIGEIAEIVRRVRITITVGIVVIVVLSLVLASSCIMSVALIVHCVNTMQQSKQQMIRMRERNAFVVDSLARARIRVIEEVKRDIQEYYAKKGWNTGLIDTIGTSMHSDKKNGERYDLK